MFTESEKKVFSYPSPDGSVALHEDPLRFRRELIVASKGEIDDWLSRVKSEEQIEAITDPTAKRLEVYSQMLLQGQLVAATRKAMGNVPPVDFQTGDGVPDAWVLETLQRFLDWIAEKKATPRQSPTS